VYIDKKKKKKYKTNCQLVRYPMSAKHFTSLSHCSDINIYHSSILVLNMVVLTEVNEKPKHWEQYDITVMKKVLV